MKRVPFSIAGGLAALSSASLATGCRGNGAATGVPCPPVAATVLSVTGVDVKSNVATLQAGAARVSITAESEHVIRVHGVANGTFRPDVSWAVVPHEGARPEWQVRDVPGGLVLALSRLR